MFKIKTTTLRLPFTGWCGLCVPYVATLVGLRNTLCKIYFKNWWQNLTYLTTFPYLVNSWNGGKVFSFGKEVAHI